MVSALLTPLYWRNKIEQDVNSAPYYYPKTLDTSDLLWVRKKGLSYFRYPELFLNHQLVHAVFTRIGGTSSPPFQGLNTSYTVGDRPEHVRANLGKIKEVIELHHLVSMNQSHGDGILVLRKHDSSLPLDQPLADAAITDMPGVAIMVKQADCQGVIIFDPGKDVVANIHCGWRGNVNGILQQVVSRMRHEFGCRGADLLAAIGPSLGPCCAEFVNYEKIFPEVFKPFMVRKNHFDLRAISVFQLLEAGLREENIKVAGICTRCRTDLFFSYRGELKTGRFGSVVMLR
jgi:YfiH family protein